MIINVAIVAAEQSTRVRVLDVLEVQLMEGSEASGDGILKRIKAARRVSMTQPARTATATASALTSAATTSASNVEAPLSKEVGRVSGSEESGDGDVWRIESPWRAIISTTQPARTASSVGAYMANTQDLPRRRSDAAVVLCVPVFRFHDFSIRGRGPEPPWGNRDAV